MHFKVEIKYFQAANNKETLIAYFNLPNARSSSHAVHGAMFCLE